MRRMWRHRVPGYGVVLVAAALLAGCTTVTRTSVGADGGRSGRRLAGEAGSQQSAGGTDSGTQGASAGSGATGSSNGGGPTAGGGTGTAGRATRAAAAA